MQVIDDMSEQLDAASAEIKRLRSENSLLRSALEFYASRSVYYFANKFPGDVDLIECSDVASTALKTPPDPASDPKGGT